MSRKESREKLFQLVFEFCFTGSVNNDSLQNALSETNDETEKKYISDIYFGIAEKYSELAGEIVEKTTGFSLERLFKIDLAIMLVSVYEMRYYNIPAAVSINEAVNIAKKYSTDKSANFVNGVLAGFVVKK